MSRTPVPELPPHAPAPALAAFEAALSQTAAAAATREGDGALVTAVGGMDAAGECAAALRALAERPRMALRLDEAVRRATASGYAGGRGRRRDEAAPDPLGTGVSPLGVVLASCDPDGRVRERAVRRLETLLRQPQPVVDVLPFLVVRTADWAGRVRDRARAALALLLHDDPKHLVPAAAAVTLLVARRERGAFARHQLLSALTFTPGTTALDPLLASTDPRLRRFALRAALAERRLPLGTLVAVTKRDGDRRCRELAAEAAVREAVWTEQSDLLRQLAASAHPEVRVLALVGLIRRGLAAEVMCFLGDISTLVRAVARDAARRTGTDALGWYRTAVRAPTPGAIAGLAETGRAADADLLTPLLGHPQALIRAAAVRGLRAMDAVPVERTVPLLRDPSTKVVREATSALRTRLDQLPGGLAESLLADRDRAAVRRAGYRLLDGRDPLRLLLAALDVATDPDPRLARRAADAAAALIRGFHIPPWPTRTTGVIPAFDPSADEQRELLDRAEAAAPRLSHRTRQLLLERMVPTSPATELLRVRHGPHPDTKTPLLEVKATFTARDPHAAIALMREVLLSVLPYAAGPAADWPADEQWPDLMPAWFVERCAPNPPPAQETSADFLTRWRRLTGQQRETEVRTDAAADWRLPDWLGLFDPEGTPDSRSWRWWHAGVGHSGTGWVRFAVDGHPYGGRGALLWLIEAAGGYGVDLP